MHTVKAKLLEERKDYGGYIIYVFENLDAKSSFDKYIMTVRFPHWESPLLRKGAVGFLKFKEVIAGKDTWWDRTTNKYICYNYDNIIFIDFIHETSDDLTVML